MSTAVIRSIHLLGFVEEVRHVHANMPDRRFCFLLGAGASKTSLIPTAGELGVEWLTKIHAEGGGVAGDFANWLNEGTHGIKELPPKTSIADVGVMAAAYPAIYRAKWGHDRAQGDAEIERHIEAARPSYGYYALAEILASDDPANPSRHNVVITPNFDNLPAETLGALGKKIPIVIGHSAITEFARPTLRRPLIIKFHHDFLLAPKSDPKDVSCMEKGYSKALAEIFRLYTPIVIGYGGNDGSLMELLEKLRKKSIPGGILWCWRTGDPPGQRIRDVVAKQGGTLIEISGFDEMMTLLEGPFGHVFNPEKLRERAAKRAQELTEAKERLTKKAESGLSPSAIAGGSDERGSPPSLTAMASAESSAVLDALSAAPASTDITGTKKNAVLPWWHWQNRINAAADLEEKEQLFNEGLQATHGAVPLLGNFANFLADQRKDYARAEEYYLKALAADPNRAITLGNYANFLKTHGKDDAQAEEYYLKALAIDPKHANNLCNYVQFLIGCGRFAEATPLVHRAWAQLLDLSEMGVQEVAFSRWLLTVLAGMDGQPVLGRLKTVLQVGNYRAPWNFDAMLAACLPKLTEEQGKLARKLAAAILDKAKVAELDDEPSWRLVQPIPLNAPWPDEPAA